MTSLSFENFKTSKLYLLSTSIYFSAPSRSNNPIGKSVLFTRSRSPKIVLTRTLCQSLPKLKASILCSSYSSKPRALLSAVPKKKSTLKYPTRLKNGSKTRQLETIIPQNENLWKLQRTILERASRLVAQRVTVDREREKFVEKSEYGLRVCPFETGKNLAACNGTCVRACMRAWVSECVRACTETREYIRDVMWCATRRRCAGIVNVMLMVLMGSRCHTSGMRIQSHAGVTLLPVYMPRVRTLRPDHLQSDLREPNEQPRAVPLYSGPQSRWFSSPFFFLLFRHLFLLVLSIISSFYPSFLVSRSLLFRTIDLLLDVHCLCSGVCHSLAVGWWWFKGVRGFGVWKFWNGDHRRILFFWEITLLW